MADLYVERLFVRFAAALEGFVSGVRDGEFTPEALAAGDGSDVDGRARASEPSVAREGASSVSL